MKYINRTKLLPTVTLLLEISSCTVYSVLFLRSVENVPFLRTRARVESVLGAKTQNKKIKKKRVRAIWTISPWWQKKDPCYAVTNKENPTLFEIWQGDIHTRVFL